MCQMRDNQLIVTIDLVTGIQFLWGGMLPHLVDLVGHCIQLWSGLGLAKMVGVGGFD